MDTPSLPELWIRYSTGMTIRESEMQTRASRPVQNVWWCFVAEPVSPIAREPQLARVRMPVESDRIANPACEHFQIAAVRVHPCNRCVPRLLVSSIAHVARSPDGHVELPVRGERDVLPTGIQSVGNVPFTTTGSGALSRRDSIRSYRRIRLISAT